MPVIPFAFQCTYQKNQILAVKNFENEHLDYDLVLKILGFGYCLSIFPNDHSDASRGELWVFFCLELENEKKVDAEFSISIESVNFSHKTQYAYEESIGWGHQKKFIVTGKSTFKVHGIFKYETCDAPNFEQQKWDGAELGNKLWEEDNGKDFTIVVDRKEIKVHKLLLRTRSDVFKVMFSPNTKESMENKVEIPDFSFNVVEIAVKMIYNCDFNSTLSLDEMMSLLHFFDKFNIPSLKEKVESVLINQFSAATVYRLTNTSIISNSIQLKKKRMKFLEESFASKTPLSDIQILDKYVLLKIVENSFYEIVRVQ